MRSTILIFAFLFSFSALGKMPIQRCINHGTFGNPVSINFQACINLNFTAVSRVSGIYTFHCSNFLDYVSYPFTSCIAENFRRIDYVYPESYLERCLNYGPDYLYPSYISCINRNFRKIQRTFSYPK